MQSLSIPGTSQRSIGSSARCKCDTSAESLSRSAFLASGSCALRSLRWRKPRVWTTLSPSRAKAMQIPRMPARSSRVPTRKEPCVSAHNCRRVPQTCRASVERRGKQKQHPTRDTRRLQQSASRQQQTSQHDAEAARSKLASRFSVYSHAHLVGVFPDCLLLCVSARALRGTRTHVNYKRQASDSIPSARPQILHSAAGPNRPFRQTDGCQATLRQNILSARSCHLGLRLQRPELRSVIAFSQASRLPSLVQRAHRSPFSDVQSLSLTSGHCPFSAVITVLSVTCGGNRTFCGAALLPLRRLSPPPRWVLVIHPYPAAVGAAPGR
eukprot:3934889-Rhodomonas_salina.1